LNQHYIGRAEEAMYSESMTSITITF